MLTILKRARGDEEEVVTNMADYEYSDEEEYEYEEDEEGGGGGAAAGAGADMPTSSVPDYRIVASDEVRAEMNKVVVEIAGVLDMPAECARTLLLHFLWNKEKLFDQYYANPETVRKAAGIEHLGESAHAVKPVDCAICFADSVPPAETFGLGCRHIFCKECWSGFLSAAVSDSGAQCIFAKCPEDGCGEVVTPSVFASMASKDIAARYERFVEQSFININRSMSWCPAPGCGNSFLAKGALKTVKCPCGMQSCFKCSNEAHQPIDCNGLGIWLDKCSNESETVNWILANTKKCPKCMVRIEKNQGCNHMTCRNRGCQFQFCWVCMGPWEEHGQQTGGYYSCNRYDPAKPTGDGAEAQAQAELDRYLFYFQRYENHDQAGKFAAKHRKLTQQRMMELQAKSTSSWADVTFLENATEALLECRRVLKYTYAFGYYMKDGSEKRLFEHLQEHLERSTETLAELTEEPLASMDRSQIVNFTRVTQKFLNQLLEGIEDGLTSAPEAIVATPLAEGAGAGAA